MSLQHLLYASQAVLQGLYMKKPEAKFENVLEVIPLVSGSALSLFGNTACASLPLCHCRTIAC